MMILVDTSVLIDYFKGTENKSTKMFHQILEKRIPFGINHVIYMEVLQGAKTERDYNALKKYLDTQTFFQLKRGKDSYAEAARMYFKLRQKGVTVKSTMDCLIAEVAIENDLFLFHNDQDFSRISNEFPLKIWEV
jgi:predicted nucleic acid-binding protein